MPETAQVRTLTEDEAYAIVADRVTRETAALTAEIDALKVNVASQDTKLELAEAALSVETAAKVAAEAELAALKESIDTERTIASRKETRVTQVREGAKGLPDSFFTPERAQKWAQLEDAAFAEHLAELAEMTAGLKPAVGATGQTRETAMSGAPVTAGSGTSAAAKLFAIRKGA